MKRSIIKKTHILLFLLIAACVPLSAADVSFTAESDRASAAVGDQVVVTASLVITNGKNTRISAPNVPSNSGFDVLRSTQNQMQSSSVQFINGQTTQTTEITYQFHYFLTIKQNGAITFPALQVTVDGTSYSSGAIAINATPAGSKALAGPGGASAAATPLSDVKVTLTVSKNNPYVGEQILLSVQVAQKAQTATALTDQGFMSYMQRLEQSLGTNFSILRLTSGQIKGTSEKIGNDVYRVFPVYFGLIPLNPGSLTIPAIPFEYEERRQVRGRLADPFFDGFFGNAVQSSPRSVLANGIKFTVTPLPPAPSGFSGAVGVIDLKATIDPATVAAGDALTLKISLHGNNRPGSLSDVVLGSMPDCEVFTPEKQTAVDTTDNGITTRKNFRYMIIPHNEGVLKLPPVSYIYFDPLAGAYKTRTIALPPITVSRGKSGAHAQPQRYLTQEDITQVGRDIRYIKTITSMNNQTAEPYKNPLYILLLPLPFLAVIFALFYKVQAGRRTENQSKNIRQRAATTARRAINNMRRTSLTRTPGDILAELTTTIETFISNRFNFAATGKTLDELNHTLLKVIKDKTAVEKLIYLLNRINDYRFGGKTITPKTIIELLSDAEQICTQCNKSASRKPPP